MLTPSERIDHYYEKCVLNGYTDKEEKKSPFKLPSTSCISSSPPIDTTISATSSFRKASSSSVSTANPHTSLFRKASSIYERSPPTIPTTTNNQSQKPAASTASPSSAPKGVGRISFQTAKQAQPESKEAPRGARDPSKGDIYRSKRDEQEADADTTHYRGREAEMFFNAIPEYPDEDEDDDLMVNDPNVSFVATAPPRGGDVDDNDAEELKREQQWPPSETPRMTRELKWQRPPPYSTNRNSIPGIVCDDEIINACIKSFRTDAIDTNRPHLYGDPRCQLLFYNNDKFSLKHEGADYFIWITGFDEVMKIISVPMDVISDYYHFIKHVTVEIVGGKGQDRIRYHIFKTDGTRNEAKEYSTKCDKTQQWFAPPEKGIADSKFRRAGKDHNGHHLNIGWLAITWVQIIHIKGTIFSRNILQDFSSRMAFDGMERMKTAKKEELPIMRNFANWGVKTALELLIELLKKSKPNDKNIIGKLLIQVAISYATVKNIYYLVVNSLYLNNNMTCQRNINNTQSIRWADQYVHSMNIGHSIKDQEVVTSVQYRYYGNFVDNNCSYNK